MPEDHQNCDSCGDQENNPSDDAVMNKYKMAGDIANSILKEISDKCVENESVLDLCVAGDKMIQERASKVFVRDKKMKKGIAFPTCINVNNVVCHMSPLKSDEVMVLKHDDVVKIDLGVHVDGYIACVATTLVVGSSKTNPATGRRADVVMAGYVAAELALKMFRPGNTNHMVTSTVGSAVSEFHCKPVEGLISYNTTKDVLEGEHRIMLNPTDIMKYLFKVNMTRKEYTLAPFKTWDVYSVDIFVSSSEEAKAKTREARTTVFRRSKNLYNLKMKVSRETLKQIITNYGEFSFSLRSFEDENKARLGIKECLNHQLVIAYPVLYEKDDEFVSHFKFTVIVGPNGPIKVVFPSFSFDAVKSEFKLHKLELLKLFLQLQNVAATSHTTKRVDG
ncbi:hypothetical protein MXB_2785 [Myxobolus squamalis]|nr:hypothetical protein MXB_2785 [Myxobolus squamalis]